MLGRWGLAPFAIYRVLAGAVLLLIIRMGGL